MAMSNLHIPTAFVLGGYHGKVVSRESKPTLNKVGLFHPLGQNSFFFQTCRWSKTDSTLFCRHCQLRICWKVPTRLFSHILFSG